VKFIWFLFHGCWISAESLIFNFPSSLVTCVKWANNVLCLLWQIWHSLQQCQNFENRLWFDEVTDSLMLGTFLKHDVVRHRTGIPLSHRLHIMDRVVPSIYKKVSTSWELCTPHTLAGALHVDRIVWSPHIPYLQRSSNLGEIFLQCTWRPNLIILHFVVRKLWCGQTY